MSDIAIAAVFAHDRVAQQFADPVRAAASGADRRAPVRHGAARMLRAVADRLEPTPRRVQTGAPVATS